MRLAKTSVNDLVRAILDPRSVRSRRILAPLGIKKSDWSVSVKNIWIQISRKAGLKIDTEWNDEGISAAVETEYMSRCRKHGYYNPWSRVVWRHGYSSEMEVSGYNVRIYSRDAVASTAPVHGREYTRSMISEMLSDPRTAKAGIKEITRERVYMTAGGIKVRAIGLTYRGVDMVSYYEWRLGRNIVRGWTRPDQSVAKGMLKRWRGEK